MSNTRHSAVFPPRSRRLFLGELLAAGAASALPLAALADDDASTYDQNSVLKEINDFFGNTTEGLAKVVEKAFKEQGRPNAYIKGQEFSGAVTVGVRYGEGDLFMKNGSGARHLYWSGPSIGLDLGGNASKVFVLAYHLPKADDVFQRFPGVDGSLYYVGGAGINYQRRDGIVLAPIRLGVGLRSGASVGYMHYRREKSLNPL